MLVMCAGNMYTQKIKMSSNIGDLDFKVKVRSD